MESIESIKGLSNFHFQKALRMKFNQVRVQCLKHMCALVKFILIQKIFDLNKEFNQKAKLDMASLLSDLFFDK